MKSKKIKPYDMVMEPSQQVFSDGEPEIRGFKYYFRRFLAILAQFWIPSWSYSNCLRCGITWNFVEMHPGYDHEGSGCFALCGTCHSDLKPNQRKKYFRKLFGEWETDGIFKKTSWKAGILDKVEKDK